MKVILRKSIEPLGRTGEVVDVATGYARNYLLPQRLAYTINADNLNRIEVDKAKFEEEERKRIADLRAFAERIKTVSCSIEAKASEEGHLYGSVTAAMIAEAAAAEGVEIEARSIQLEKPIKETGVFTVGVHLHADINSELKVWVMDSSEEGKADGEEGDDAASGSEGDDTDGDAN